MHELLQIRTQLDAMQYKDAGSLFDLRMLLMSTGTFLTSSHLGNQQTDKNKEVSTLLMQSFRTIRQYYHILEITKEGQEQCFRQIKELTIQALVNLYKKLSSHKTNIFILPQERPLMLGIAR
jgi:hypothetical protein